MATNNNEFKGVSHIGNRRLMNILETNLVTWLDWSFLRIGGWMDVDIPSTGIGGGDFSTLRAIEDETYTNGQVWEGTRKDWVWETGVDYVDIDNTTRNPNAVGTPTVDGVAATGSYHVNHPLGRIVFDSPISTSAIVKVKHAYRSVQVYRADDASWFTELQYMSFSPEDIQINNVGLSTWRIGSNHRVQMPAIIIEAVPRGSAKGRELGTASRMDLIQDILFHIIAEDRTTRNDITDIIRQQHDGSIWLFDNNTLVADEAWPLDSKGSLVGSLMYPDMVAETGDGGYRWDSCYMENMVISEVQELHTNLHESTVRATVRVDFASR